MEYLKKIEERKDLFYVVIGALVAGGIAYLLTRPKYPKTITRGDIGISVKAYDETQEKHIKEFLGIDPPGVDPITFLKRRGRTFAYKEWKPYWYRVFSIIGRKDLHALIEYFYNQVFRPARNDLAD